MAHLLVLSIAHSRIKRGAVIRHAEPQVQPQKKVSGCARSLEQEEHVFNLLRAYHARGLD